MLSERSPNRDPLISRSENIGDVGRNAAFFRKKKRDSDGLSIIAFGRGLWDRWLFPSRLAGENKPLHRQTAHNALKRAFIAAGLNGKLATHSLRKSFAQRLYDATDDIYVVQEMLGHKNVTTTQGYLGVNYAKVREAVESMVAMPAIERDIISILSCSEISGEVGKRSEMA